MIELLSKIFQLLSFSVLLSTIGLYTQKLTLKLSSLAGDTTAAKLEFFATSGPPFTEVQVNQTELNKGNVASIYTDQFGDEPTIDGAEIRDLVKQQMEEKLRHTLAIKNKDATKPFKWSESDFKDHAPKALPDVWDFSTFKPQWVW